MTEQEIKIRQQVAQSFQDIKTVADLTKLMNEVWSYLCKGVHKRIPLKDVTYFSNYKLAKDAYYKFLIPKKNGKTRGENTDGKGFVKAISEVTSVQGKKLVVFGAGGASRAICVEMALAGASEITVVNISEDGQILVDMLNQHTPTSASFVLWDHIFNIPADTDIVINATSVGLYPNVEQRLNINADTLKPHMVVADCIPNPAYTHFVKDAISKGCRHVLPGMNMLVNQAVIALKYWTGNDVDADIMRQELTRVLGL